MPEVTIVLERGENRDDDKFLTSLVVSQRGKISSAELNLDDLKTGQWSPFLFN